MNRTSLAAAIIVATGYHSAAFADGSSHGDVGRYVVVPAGHTDLSSQVGPNLFSTWRLDTETGVLEFCTYSSGMLSNKGAYLPESLTCTAESPNPAAPINTK